MVFPKDGDGCRWNSTPHGRQTRVRLQGVGHVRVHRHRAVRGRVRTISVKRVGTRWYVILACDEVPAEPLPATGSIVGIDMGVRRFFTTSDGEHVAHPRFLRVMAGELAEAQWHLATFPKRTRRRTKKHRAAARKVATIHAKIRRQRLDHHHKRAIEDEPSPSELPDTRAVGRSARGPGLAPCSSARRVPAAVSGRAYRPQPAFGSTLDGD
ncbi:transposase [Streptomyces fungicidicus]|uniref:transposase n=1 Tax=Streptomyces fungicidicus TaxID=68203 RepID=UPI00379E9F69